MTRAAPSREAPSATNDLEVGTTLKLGEYADQPPLNTSEARIILKKTLDSRRVRGRNLDETETLAKTRDYLEIFAVFKEIPDAQQVEGIIETYGKELARFEKSQLGSLVPTCADEARRLIPSLMGQISDQDLDDLCKDLQRLKRQAQL